MRPSALEQMQRTTLSARDRRRIAPAQEAQEQKWISLFNSTATAFFDSAAYRKLGAKWLFPREKVTLHTLKRVNM
jgi:hypothetical protein